MNAAKACGVSVCPVCDSESLKYKTVRGRRVRTTLRERKLMRWLALTNTLLLDTVADRDALRNLCRTYVDEIGRLRGLLESNGIDLTA